MERADGWTLHCVDATTSIIEGDPYQKLGQDSESDQQDSPHVMHTTSFMARNLIYANIQVVAKLYYEI